MNAFPEPSSQQHFNQKERGSTALQKLDVDEDDLSCKLCQVVPSSGQFRSLVDEEQKLGEFEFD